MKISTMFPSKWLKAEDLSGREHTVTITKITLENVAGQGSEDEEKPIMYFAGKTKGLVINRTKAAIISAVYGDEVEGWINKPLIIFPGTTMYKSQMVDCINVRLPLPAANLPGQEDIPF